MNSLSLSQSTLGEQPNRISASASAVITPGVNPVTNPVTNPSRRNGASEAHLVDVHKLLEPIRPALQQVENKMRPLDSSAFAPLVATGGSARGSGE